MKHLSMKCRRPAAQFNIKSFYHYNPILNNHEFSYKMREGKCCDVEQ